MDRGAHALPRSTRLWKGNLEVYGDTVIAIGLTLTRSAALPCMLQAGGQRSLSAFELSRLERKKQRVR